MTRRNGDLDRTNDRAAKRRKRLHDYRQRTTQSRERRKDAERRAEENRQREEHRRRQRRDQCRLLALLTETGVLRSW